jgi:hypothetical protein
VPRPKRMPGWISPRAACAAALLRSSEVIA